ncbi:hypothetical protein [Mycobacterium sp. ITM-2016-00318]|uniref:hypothetical protein n=1 Tax=Mycobacterium sp. ITM-2016-00318 TaxID=2099693 RepID=UPI000CF8DDF5|nr:hypothetical protein [Mycobacterium sp. ITM-2016-00318]WNG90605.1 hypothetical protein C6A82_013575 [Mycobacterium sp. ITM-2016-00318]
MRYVLRPFAMWWHYFPQLAALYLLGWFGRKGAIELAAYVGWDNDVWASLIMPFAGLARLGSYGAMFLVLRSAIPVLAALPRRSARSVDVFANIIVPFFAIYLAWKLFAEDWLEFETAALDYRVADSMTTALTTGQSSGGLHPDELPISGVTWAIIAAALVARYVLSRFKDSLPRWVIGIRVYVDALWVFLTLSFAATQGATFVLDPMGWIGERRIIVWADSIRAELFSYFTPLEILWDAAMAVLRTAFGGATIPLLWLAVAGIVYGVSMPDWRDVARRVVGDRADIVFERADAGRRRLSQRGWRVDNDVGTRFAGWARARMGNYSNIVDSARLILHGGALAITLYICGYLALAWLDMAGAFYRPEVSIGYLFRSIAWLFGPHPITFWNGFADTIALVSHVIVEPLRVCLIAATVAYCLEQVGAKDDSTTKAAAP